MSRAARLLQLIQALRRRRRPVTGQELAGELGISRRSLYRDIATLRGQGAPIEGEPGVGYLLRPGFTLPPLMFSVEEIEALALGSRWVAARGDAAMAAAARHALVKIAAVLPDALRDDLDDLPLLVGPGAAPSGRVDLEAIRAAIRRERKIAIRYETGKGDETSRTVWPFALGYFERAHVLAAWCELRQDYRSFRTDRIAGLDVTDSRYPRRRAALLAEWRRREGLPPP